MATFAENRKARFNYELLETLEAGIELVGHEVRSVRTGGMTLEGAHITVRGGEAFLIGAAIAPYQPNNSPVGYDSRRHRRLLLTKKEIRTLEGTESQKGLTIVPISVYAKGRRIKISIAIARGKKKHDKRETLKRRDDEREIQRARKGL